jgi:hypothetical protein
MTDLSYTEGGDQEDQSSRLVWAKSYRDPASTKQAKHGCRHL